MIQQAQQFSVEMKLKDEGPYRRIPQSTTQPSVLMIPRILCKKNILLTMVPNSPAEYHIQSRWLLRETQMTTSITTTGYMAYLLMKMDNSVLSSSLIIESRPASSINSLGVKYTRPRIRLKDKKRNKEKVQILIIQVQMPLGIFMIDLMMQMIVIKKPKSRIRKKDDTQYLTICMYSTMLCWATPLNNQVEFCNGYLSTSHLSHALGITSTGNQTAIMVNVLQKVRHYVYCNFAIFRFQFSAVNLSQVKSLGKILYTHDGNKC